MSDPEDDEDQGKTPAPAQNRYSEIKGTVTLYANVAELPPIADLAPPEFSETEKTVKFRIISG